MKKLTQPRTLHPALDPRSEDGQTMAEYSVVVTLIVLVMGIGAFVAFALAVAGEFGRVTGLFDDLPSIP